MRTLFEHDELAVRLTRHSADTETIGFTLLDAAGDAVGYATQRVGAHGSTLRRQLHEDRSMPVSFDLTDVSDAREWIVDKRKAGRIGLAHHVAVHDADGHLEATARSGRATPRTYELADGNGSVVATLHRGGSDDLVVDTAGGARVAHAARGMTTLVARQAGLAHEGWNVRYEPDASRLVRLATLAVTLVIDGALLPRTALFG